MFIFKGKNSNEMGVYVREENFLGKAPMRYDSIEIEGKHGADLVELGYQNFEGTLNDVVIMNDNFDEVLNWLSGTGELIYMGKKTQIHFLDAYQIAKHKRTFSIPFIREPFWSKLDDEYEESWGVNLIPGGWSGWYNPSDLSTPVLNPIVDGLTRVQISGGELKRKLTKQFFDLPEGVYLDFSIYIEANNPMTMVLQSCYPAVIRGSYSFVVGEKKKINLEYLQECSFVEIVFAVEEVSQDLDFIASDPQIVEGDKPATWEADSNPRIVNEGTAPAQPLIKLTKGTQATCEYEVNGVYFKYHFNNDDHVIIDCDEMNATYKGLPRNRHLTIGFEFPVLKVGDNVVKKVSGDAKIEFKRKDRWL